jgi:hypothetical protein
VGTSISAEAAWRLNGLDFAEVEVADGLQDISRCTVLQAGRQKLLGDILTLQGGQLSDRISSTLGAGAMIDWSARPDHRNASSTSSAALFGRKWHG